MKNLLMILLIIKCIDGTPRLDPLVSTSQGLIRGLPADDGDYAMFLGIPYAVVDQNDPFSAATPHPGFNETYEAYHDDIACPQFKNFAFGTIHCLQLNIYVPNTASSTNTLPVIVYLHGGSYVRGHKTKQDMSPKFLVKLDVIVITINYRLGPYGFLCVSEPGYSNQGMKDQVFALKWIKDNIGDFGGDASRITAMGQSAGAITLDILLLAHENLVQRVILMSGMALSPWVITPQNDTIPLSIATRLGFDGADVKTALEYLSNQNPTDVIEAANDLDILYYLGHPMLKPCVENDGEDAILTDYPVNLSPKVKGMDILIGHANREAMFLYPNSNKEYYANYKFRDELALGFDVVHDEDTVRHFYIGDKDVSEDLQPVILDFASDNAFNYPAVRTIDKYLNANAKRVFKYVFSYEGGRNRLKISRNLTSEGASHGDDLGYLFDMPMFDDETPSEDDQRIIDVMTTMWTNFAKYGNPTPSTSDLITVQWLPVEQSRRPFLNIDKNITLDSRTFHSRLAFWELYYKLHGDKEKGFKSNKK